MALLELLASPPGTGKTFYCIDLFKKEILKTKGGIESRSFFILPSREHADRIQNLILKKDIPGLFNVHLLTINDLASRLLGISARQEPTEPLRKSIIREILEGDDAQFPYFGAVKNCHGFHDLLADAIKEFKAGLLTVKAFEQYSQSLLKDPVFRSKFRDLSIVLKNYEARLSELGLHEPEEALLKVLDEIKKIEAPNLVIFDGFYHFTRAQQSLIDAVSRWSRHTVVTLTLSNDDKKRGPLFEYPERTQEFLQRIGFKRKKGVFKSNHRTQDVALLHLEKNLFSENLKPYSKSQTSVRLIQAPNARVEVEMIAREIKKIYRETSVHWSDLCVILRELRGYEKLVHSVFRDFQIPVHVHERNKLIENGLVKVFYRFLDLQPEGWKREDLMFVLKSAYWSKKLTTEDAFLLESAAVSENLLEGRERWVDLVAHPALSSKAREALQALLQFEKSLVEAGSIAEFNARFLSWANSFYLVDDSTDTGSLDRQALETVVAILKTAQHYYDQSTKRIFTALFFMREFQDALEAGLFSVKPRGRNRVQVYDVVMALPKEYKVVFLPGLLEKTFPKSITEDPIFKDAERRIINQKKTVLEERLPRIAGERYFFYMAVTRAKERLILSYPQYDTDGRPALASFFVEEVEKCFKEKLPVTRKAPADFLPLPEEWSNEREVTRGLAEIIFRPGFSQRPQTSAELPTLPKGLAEWTKKEPFKRILEFGFSDDKALLTDPKAKEVFRLMKGPFSATKLETFATCAFKYFSSRVLRLNEPLEGRQAIEMGNLLHKVLEEFYKELPREEKESGIFLKEGSVMTDALHRKLELLMMKSPLAREPLYRQRMHLESMKKTLALFVEHEKKLFMKRGLVPAYFELKFGGTGKNDLDYLKVNDPGGDILIEGQIDRIDIEKNKAKALVIDYKRSAREFGVHEKLKKELEFQLPVYLLAAQRLLGLEAAGAELRILRDAANEGLYRESCASLLGLHPNVRTYSDDEFEKILSHTEDLIRENIKRLRTADISVKSKSCNYCSFSSVCRFEPWRLVYSEEHPS